MTSKKYHRVLVFRENLKTIVQWQHPGCCPRVLSNGFGNTGTLHINSAFFCRPHPRSFRPASLEIDVGGLERNRGISTHRVILGLPFGEDLFLGSGGVGASGSYSSL